MAGAAQTEVRVLIDKSAMEKLKDFGEVVVKGPGNGLDAVRILYKDEDLDKEHSDSPEDQPIIQPARGDPQRDRS